MTQTNTPELSGDQTDKGADVLDNQALMNEIKALREENDLLKVKKKSQDEAVEKDNSLSSSIKKFEAEKEELKRKESLKANESSLIDELIDVDKLSVSLGSDYNDYFQRSKRDFSDLPIDIRNKQLKAGLFELFFSKDDNKKLLRQGSLREVDSFFEMSEKDKVLKIDHLMPILKDATSIIEDLNQKKKMSILSVASDGSGLPKTGNIRKKFRAWKNKQNF